MNTNDQLKKLNLENRWTKASKQLLENELMESYLYENLTRFQNTKFESSQQSLNKATEIMSYIYIKLSDKCMKKRYCKKKRKKKSSWTDSQLFALRSTVNAYSKKFKLFPFKESIRNKYLFYVKQIKKSFKIKKERV